jgi:hypothetical protein
VTLTFMFDLLSQNISLGCICCMVCIRILIFHISVCCDKTYPWLPTGLTLWPSPLCLTYLQKIWTLTISFEWYLLGLWDLTRVFLETFPWVATDLNLWHWPWSLAYILKNLNLVITFEWYALGLGYFIWVFLATRPFPGLLLAIFRDVITVMKQVVTLAFDLLFKSVNVDMAVNGIWYSRGHLNFCLKSNSYFFLSTF